jgi:hypothetical protein
MAAAGNKKFRGGFIFYHPLSKTYRGEEDTKAGKYL